jgi:hypothetical protein
LLSTGIRPFKQRPRSVTSPFPEHIIVSAATTSTALDTSLLALKSDVTCSIYIHLQGIAAEVEHLYIHEFLQHPEFTSSASSRIGMNTSTLLFNSRGSDVSSLHSTDTPLPFGRP